MMISQPMLAGMGARFFSTGSDSCSYLAGKIHLFNFQKEADRGS